MEPRFERLPVLDLLLNKENPRHQPKTDQDAIIEHLCSDEQVENLAKHISLHGINPLENVAVYKSGKSLIVAEGNRRVCAMQLLNDPDRAPSRLRKRFTALAKNKLVPSEVNVLIFDQYEDVKPWMDIIHGGQQDGVGRKNWDADQKARSLSKNTRETLALKILDYAEQAGILKGADRRKMSLTTVSRYINNPDVRSAMGITSSVTDPDVVVDVNETMFDSIIEKFVEDIKNKKLTSRSIAKDWKAYADEIRSALKPEEGKEAPRQIFEADTESPTKGGNKTTLKSQIPRRIPKSAGVIDQLNRIRSDKLTNLYRSLTGLSLRDHPALITAGSWIFLESITALHGRKGASFESYFNSKFNEWGLSRDEKKDLDVSVKFIADHGNAEKHSKTFTSLNAENLVTHFNILEDAIVRLLSDVKAGK